MKNIFKYLLVTLSVIGLLINFSSCEDDTYDFNKVVPGIFNLSGPTEVVGTGKTPYSYSVSDRTGSTYEWKLVGTTGTISFPVKGMTSIVDITFDKSDVDIPDALLIVTEKTSGGLVSDPDTLNITQLKYCDLDLSQFVGDYVVTDGFDSGNCSITLDANDEFFGLIIHDILSYWGFPAGEGGTLYIKMNGCDNTITFDKQATGAIHPTYGDVSMEAVDGNGDPVKGSFDLATGTLRITAEHTVDAGSFGSWEVVLTKQK